MKNSVVIAVCALAFSTAGSAYGQPVTNPPYEITGTDPTGATYTYLWGWYLSSFYITDNAVEGDLVGCGAAGVQVMLPSLNVPAPRRAQRTDHYHNGSRDPEICVIAAAQLQLEVGNADVGVLQAVRR